MAIRRDRPRRLRWLSRLAVICGATLLTASCFGSGDAPSSAPSTEAGAKSEVSASPTPTPEPPPENGACRRVSVRGLRTIVNDDPTVRCKRKHTAATFAVARIPAPAARDALSAADQRVENAA